ncbi:MAG: hypothetical protein GY751_15580 [Bacteroidetes bacterium]|nr:hypothetical protein [Bacteroidota bacterium]
MRVKLIKNFAVSLTFFISLAFCGHALAEKETFRNTHKQFYKPGQVLNAGKIVNLASAGLGTVSEVSFGYNMVRSALEVDWLYDGKLVGHSVLDQGVNKQVQFVYEEPIQGNVEARLYGSSGQIQILWVSIIVTLPDTSKAPLKRVILGESGQKDLTTGVPQKLKISGKDRQLALAMQTDQEDVGSLAVDTNIGDLPSISAWKNWEVVSRTRNLASGPTSYAWREASKNRIWRGGIFYLTLDDKLIEQRWYGSGWDREGTSEFQGVKISKRTYTHNNYLAGIGSAPGCTSHMGNEYDCFILDYLGRLWWKAQGIHARGEGKTAKDFMKWSEIKGATLTSSPSATSWQRRRIDVFARGEMGQLMHIWLDVNKDWSDWEDLGLIQVREGRKTISSKLTSAPACTSPRTGRIDCFARGENNNVYHNWYINGKWQGWEDFGGKLTSSPTATSWGEHRIDIFGRGEQNQLIHRYWDGRKSKWSSWENLGGELTSAPSCTAYGTRQIDCFARGRDVAMGIENVLLHKQYQLPMN